jgi:pimeloyl-ACP methyl ester carboxylesterase
MHRAVRILVPVIAAIVLLAIGAALVLGVRARTPPFRDADDNELAGSIAVLEKVELGGLEQWILIRGADRANPILLWLHGGPGGAQMPFAHRLDGELERHFVVVHWDQRGAGKSNHGGFDEATMRLDRYLADALELIAHLRERSGRQRIVLLGHSWGTRLGMELVAMRPEHIAAYIGVSQVVDHERATAIAHAWLRETIDSARAPADWQTLGQIEIPAVRHSEFRRLNSLTNDYGGSLDVSITALARIAIGAPEYTLPDYFRLLRGMNRGGGPMHEGGVMERFDLIESIPRVAVPVFFFAGRNDYNTPLALVREYYQRLEAPHRELVVFEQSAHLPFLSEPEKFTREVIRVGGIVRAAEGG